MAARMTDRQRKKIVADYLDTQSINAAAKRNGVSWDSARKAIEEAGDIKTLLQQKKDQNTADILAYMEGKRREVCEIIDTGLQVLPQKIQDARTASDVTTALGTLIDKFTAGRAPGQMATEDDPITRSLKEDADRGVL